ncbi:MAG TPA: hypothetical protein PKX48_15300 [Planctomycetota bacterium]|nr:hypothetical protein [Planctomycetota bacterium]OQC19150.1 MAG: hypothetical protein BWX69_02961 [Planctomycetes bacterium ADurb.Bin069]HNS00446.1 hypothetical protein [Planctomycetota bacterium]HNU27275.1 hypothetical protein [Planctomycetota bacterium]HOE31392.1 hypothetical protein [Planctomycetota bacterium]
MRKDPCCHSCCLSGVSRRSFMAASAGAFAAPLAAAPAAEDSGNLAEQVDLASFRPRPRVRIMSAVIRLKPPYWLGWPGTAYPIEAERDRYGRVFADLAAKVGVELETEAAPLESDDEVAAYIAKVKDRGPQAVFVMLQHMSAWRWADAFAKAGIPTIFFAPVGMAFTGHVREISRRPGVHVISSLDTNAVEQAFRMVRAKEQLAATRLLVVAGGARQETVMDRLGTKIRYVPRARLNELFERMPVTEEVREVARAMEKNAQGVVEPTAADFLNSARSFTTAKRLMRDERSNAITTDCLGMVSSRVMPTPPCMSVTLFGDSGVSYGCEADLNAALGMLFVNYLFDKAGFMNDPVPETYNNTLIAAHCTCGTKLDGFDKESSPYIARSHSESNLGVAPQVLWRKDAAVTLVNFRGPHELILDTGRVVGNVQTPPAGGCRTSVQIAMDRVPDSRDVLGFHQFVFYGDHRRDVEAFCQMYGIKVVNSDRQGVKA